MREVTVSEVFAVFLAHIGTVNPGVAAIAMVENVVHGKTEIQRFEHFLLPFVIDVQVADEIRVEAALQIGSVVDVLSADILPLQVETQVVDRLVDKIEAANEVGREGNIRCAEESGVIAAVFPIFKIIGETEDFVTAQSQVSVDGELFANLVVG